MSNLFRQWGDRFKTFFYNNIHPRYNGTLQEVVVTAPAPGKKGQPYIQTNYVKDFISDAPAWTDDLIFDEVPFYDEDGLLQTPVKVGRNNQFGNYNYYYYDPKTGSYIDDNKKGKEMFDEMEKKAYRVKSRNKY